MGRSRCFKQKLLSHEFFVDFTNVSVIFQDTGGFNAARAATRWAGCAGWKLAWCCREATLSLRRVICLTQSHRYLLSIGLDATFIASSVTILATSYRSAEAPSRQKCRKKCFGKCRSQTGVPRKVPKKCFGLRASCIAYTEARRPKHFFGTFLGTPFGTCTFRSTFSALLSGRGFGTSVAGRQDCKSSVSLGEHMRSTTNFSSCSHLQDIHELASSWGKGRQFLYMNQGAARGCGAWESKVLAGHRLAALAASNRKTTRHPCTS